MFFTEHKFTLVVAIFNVLEFLIIFGVARFIKLISLFAEVPSALFLVLLFLASFFVYLIGYKANITTSSFVTAWISEIILFYFSFISKIWQVHAGLEFGFYTALVLRIINTILLAVILVMYYWHSHLKRKYKKRFNIFE